jgi:hypothetical protein
MSTDFPLIIKGKCVLLPRVIAYYLRCTINHALFCASQPIPEVARVFDRQAVVLPPVFWKFTLSSPARVAQEFAGARDLNVIVRTKKDPAFQGGAVEQGSPI